MIAYALLGIAAKTNKVRIDALRVSDLARQFLFERRQGAAVDKPLLSIPPTNRQILAKPDELQLCMTFPGPALRSAGEDSRWSSHVRPNAGPARLDRRHPGAAEERPLRRRPFAGDRPFPQPQAGPA